MLYLEHSHACRFQKPFHGKFYRETGRDKKKIAQNINNQNNRRVIQNFLNHGIPFIDAKDAPNPELYEVADFLAYISGFCLHESQKKVFRQLKTDQIFKGKTFFQWYNEFLNKECYNVKLFNDVKNMKIENGVWKWNVP